MNEMTKRSIEELKAMIAEKRESLRVFRFGAAGSRARNVREGRTLRKEIAQALTELRSREIASAKK